MATVSLTGQAEWARGNLDHPIPLATVEIYLKTTHGSRLLKTTQTHETGAYSVNVNVTPPSSGAVTLYAKVLAESPYTNVEHALGKASWSVTSADLKLTAKSIARPSTKKLPVVTAVQAAARAFSTHSALVMAGQYANDIAGSHPTQIAVVMNNSVKSTKYDPNLAQILVLNSDGFDWDVTQHEYGHYFAAFYHFTAHPGGEHSFGTHNNVELAYSEGWADFFAIAVQRRELARPYAANIPRLADTFYTDVEPTGGINVDIANEVGVGEDDELSVAGFLYHLTQGDQDYFTSDKKLFQKLTHSTNEVLGDVWGILAKPLKPEMRANLGHMLALENVAPLATKPSNNGFSAVPPKFQWKVNGASPNLPLNDFEIAIYNDDFTTQIATFVVPDTNVDGAGNAYYTPTAAEWANITSNYSSIQWIVQGMDTVIDPATPGGKVDRYWNQASALTVRSAPIYETRTTVGLAGTALQPNLPFLVGFLATVRLTGPVDLDAVYVTVDWGDGQTTMDSTVYLLPNVGPNYFGIFNDHVYADAGDPDTITPYTVHFTIHVDGYDDTEGTTTAYVSNT